MPSSGRLNERSILRSPAGCQEVRIISADFPGEGLWARIVTPGVCYPAHPVLQVLPDLAVSPVVGSRSTPLIVEV